MPVYSQPVNGKTYFLKSIPDIVFSQVSSAETVTFKLYVNAVLVLEEDYTFDTNSMIYIKNLQDVIKSYLSSNIVSEQSTYLKDSGLIQSCSFLVTDNASWNFGASFNVLKSESEISEDADTWCATNFLCRTIRQKRTSINSTEYLSFVNKVAYGAITGNFKLYYYDSAGAYLEETGTFVSVPVATENEVVTVNCSLSKVIQAYTPSQILQFDIWMTGTNFETVKFSFLVDHNQYQFNRYFVFLNSFGVLETFRATGIMDDSKKVDYGINVIDREYVKTSYSLYSEKEVNSGILETDEMEWVNDFIISDSIGLYTPGVSGMSRFIVLTGVSKKDTKENVIQAFSFKYIHATVNHLEFANAASGIFDFTFDETYE